MQPSTTPYDRVRVLYIAGAGRSGGTLLGKMLGEHSEMLYVGELRETWTPILTTERLCGCGRRVMDCVFWKQVFDRAYGGLDKVDLGWMNAMRLKHTRTRHAMLARGTPERVRFAEHIERLYHTLVEVSRRRIVVDTSRVPGYAQLLESISSLDVRVIHLVRDPRAVMHSWQRIRQISLASGSALGRSKAGILSAVEWVVQNWLVERRWGSDPTRYYRLRYEDLIQTPRDSLRILLGWAGVDSSDLSFVGDGWVILNITHSIAGNQYRLLTGRVDLVLDDAWKTASDPRHRVAEWLLHPMRRRYGY